MKYRVVYVVGDITSYFPVSDLEYGQYVVNDIFFSWILDAINNFWDNDAEWNYMVTTCYAYVQSIDPDDDGDIWHMEWGPIREELDEIGWSKR